MDKETGNQFAMKIIKSSLLGKLMAITGSGTAFLIAAIVYALIQSQNSIDHYSDLINNPVAEERGILHLEAKFKIQVQEWKNTLIRGADPKSFDKYWGNFQKEEAAIQQAGGDLVQRMTNPKAKALLQQFLTQVHGRCLPPRPGGVQGQWLCDAGRRQGGQGH